MSPPTPPNHAVEEIPYQWEESVAIVPPRIHSRYESCGSVRRIRRPTVIYGLTPNESETEFGSVAAFSSVTRSLHGDRIRVELRL